MTSLNCSGSVVLLRAASVDLAWSTRIIARWIIDASHIELQLTLGYDLFRYAVWAGQLAKRVEELGSEVDLLAEPTSALNPSQLVMALIDAADSLRKTSDEPSRLIVKNILSSVNGDPLCVTDISSRLPQERLWGAATFDNWPNLCELTHRYPGRDSRLLRIAPSARPFEGDMSAMEVTRSFLHYNLTELELPTMEICARMILEFRDMPWEFVTDMARQVWDEARHASAFMQRLSELGGTVGDYSHTHGLWDMTAQQPLEVQLAIHQRIGEWTGVCGALWNAERHHRIGDPITAELLEFVARDEINHVAYGNKWIRHLCQNPQALQDVLNAALSRRTAFGRTSDGPPIFPIAHWARERAGFTKSEIQAMDQHVAHVGTRFQPWN